MAGRSRLQTQEPRSFMDYVQAHERNWGTKGYAGRPDLSEILSAEVVVFWQYDEEKDEPWRITLHEDTDDVERYLLRLLLKSQSQPLNQRFVRVFRNQKRLTISGVKIIFAETNE